MKHFQIKEFDSPDITGSGSEMDENFLLMLEDAREEAGVVFKINSGFRTEQHNHDVGGSDTSSHLKGLAADIHCSNSYNRLIILYALIETGFKRIGIAKTFIHVDLDNSKPDAVWLY